LRKANPFHSQALATLVNEKQNNKKAEETFNKEQDYHVSVARKQQYDQVNTLYSIQV